VVHRGWTSVDSRVVHTGRSFDPATRAASAALVVAVLPHGRDWLDFEGAKKADEAHPAEDRISNPPTTEGLAANPNGQICWEGGARRFALRSRPASWDQPSSAGTLSALRLTCDVFWSSYAIDEHIGPKRMNRPAILALGYALSATEVTAGQPRTPANRHAVTFAQTRRPWREPAS